MKALGRRGFFEVSLASIVVAGCRDRGTTTSPSPASSAPSASASTAAPPAPIQSGPFDLVIRGGLVLDGLGAPARRADIGIRNGRIVAIGEVEGGKTEIDARDRHVCPGFIDLHSHADETCLAFPATESTIRQGVTTVVVGQDGSSVAPQSAASSKDQNKQLGWNEDFTTFAGYQRALERHPASVNIASFIGQGRIRGQVMGDRPGKASAQELAKMQALAKEALDAGAFGITSGLEYLPGANAERDELAELCKVLAPMRAIYMTHMRNEDDRLLEAIEESISIARDAGARLHLSHLKASGKRNWQKMAKALELLDAARDVDATADAYPYVAYSTTLQNLFPPELRAGGTKTFLEALRDPTKSIPLRKAAEAKVAMLGSWDAVMLTGLRGTPRKAWDGQTVGELATRLGRPPLELVIELLIEREGNVGMLGFGMSEDNVAKAIAHPRIAVASDGASLAAEGPLSNRKTHPRAYGTFPRVLARHVREKQVISLAEAVRKMTSFPATILGLQDRGRIAVGAWGDLVLFDPTVVEDKATFEEAHRYPVGITQVLVNGQVTIDTGRHTGARAGRVLRRLEVSGNGR